MNGTMSFIVIYGRLRFRSNLYIAAFAVRSSEKAMIVVFAMVKHRSFRLRLLIHDLMNGSAALLVLSSDIIKVRLYLP